MEHDKIIESLEMNEGIFRYILAPDLPMDVHWKPNPQDWNLLQIVCHLRDKEVLDFRSRTEHLLQYPEMPMPEINSENWPTLHKYEEKQYISVLADFIKERKASIEWLWDLEDPEWTIVNHHPKLGDLSAEQFLANWLAHDYRFIAQINKLHHQFLIENCGVSLEYSETDGIVNGTSSI